MVRYQGGTSWGMPLSLRLSAVLLMLPLLAHAGPSVDLDAAQASLDQDQPQQAVATLSLALAAPDALKPKQRGPAWLLLAQAYAAQGQALERSSSPVRAVRDVWVQGLSAATRAVSFPDQSPEAEAVALRLREGLFLQAVERLEGDTPSDASSWVDALEGAEGPTVESRTLRGLLSVAQSDPKAALAVLAPLTATADLGTTPTRTPSWGLAYRFQARAVLTLDATARNEALAVLERGLIWHSRATTDLGPEHDLALRRVRRALAHDRLDLLVQVPERNTEALYALETVLADNVGNTGLYAQYSAWLESTFPDRALTLYQDAVAARPEDPVLHGLLGQHLARRAQVTQLQVKALPLGHADREVLQHRLELEKAEAERHLARAEALRGAR